MKLPENISVRRAYWAVDRDILKAIREKVFVREQGVPVELEWDEFDEQSQHVVAIADELPIGTGRLLPDGHIGRMAVLRRWRGQGTGSAILVRLVEIARTLGLRRVLLNAQVQALPFYAAHGFQAEGGEFLDAGIPHRRMWRDI